MIGMQLGTNRFGLGGKMKPLERKLLIWEFQVSSQQSIVNSLTFIHFQRLCEHRITQVLRALSPFQDELAVMCSLEINELRGFYDIPIPHPACPSYPIIQKHPDAISLIWLIKCGPFLKTSQNDWMIHLRFFFSAIYTFEDDFRLATFWLYVELVLNCWSVRSCLPKSLRCKNRPGLCLKTYSHQQQYLQQLQLLRQKWQMISWSHCISAERIWESDKQQAFIIEITVGGQVSSEWSATLENEWKRACDSIWTGLEFGSWRCHSHWKKLCSDIKFIELSWNRAI